MKITDSELIQRYQQTSRAVRQIAQEESVSIQAVYWHLKRLNIPRRSNSEAHIGIRPSNYKGGWIDRQGYHCQWINGKTVRTHRIKARAKPGQIVHHKNHNRQDNGENNLEVLESQSEHMKIHMTPDKARRMGRRAIRRRRAALKAAREGE